MLALAALALATVGRLRYAIMALGALVLMTWLNFMPSVVRHGLDFSGVSAFETPVADHRVSADGRLRHRARRTQPSGWGLPHCWSAFPRCTACCAVIAFGIGVFLYGF